jgi:hypothetical protein
MDTLEYDYDFDAFVQTSRRRTIAVYCVAVGCLLIALIATITVRPQQQLAPTLAESIDWSDQDQVPMSSDSDRTSEEMATTIDRLFYEHVERLGNQPEPPEITIPQDQRVVVVGRFSFDSDLQYTLATGNTGSFAQTCVIEDDGSIRLIGYDNGRALFGYVGPGYMTAPFEEKCTGIEFFFEPTK